MPESLMSAAAVASIGTWLHVSACVLLPLAWGVATELFFRWLSRRGGKNIRRPHDEHHFIVEYHI